VSIIKLQSPIELSDFTVGETIGIGALARVRFVRHKSTESVWALKILKKITLTRMKQINNTISEKKVLSLLSHPFIVQLLGTFHDVHNVYMLLELVNGGDLFRLLEMEHVILPVIARFYIAQLVLALQYIHSLDIAYRDIKTENIMIDKHGYCKLIDFGYAKQLNEMKTYTLCGCADYTAPEMVQSRGHGGMVDWWALGVLAYELLTGYTPFSDSDPFKTYQRIISVKYKFPLEFESNAKYFVSKLLVYDTQKRCGAAGGEDVRRSEWFREMDWNALARCQLTAPITPSVSGDDDISNFDKYPASADPDPDPDPPRWDDPVFAEFC